MLDRRFMPARVGILVALTFFISNPEIAIAQTVPEQEPASAQTGGPTASKPVSLELGSNEKQLSVAALLQQAGTDSVHIVQNGSPVNIKSTDNVTGGQYAAILQTLGGGAQNLILDHDGVAVGGSFSLTQTLAGSLGGLSIPKQVLVDHDFGVANVLNIAGNFVNAGTFSGSSSVNGITAVISAANITNLATGLITTGNGGNTLNLVLSTPGVFSNLGTVNSSGNLAIAAGSIVNGPGGVLQAQGNIAAIASSVLNAGLMESISGNVTFAQSAMLASLDAGTSALLGNMSSQLTRDLLINNQGGTIKGSVINVAASDLTEIVNVRGGNLLSDVLGVQAPSAVINIEAGELTGDLNLSAREAHVSASTAVLSIGNVCMTGDPTFYNTSGDIVINGALTFAGAPLALVASGDIKTGAGAGAIDTSSTSVNGGDILLVAGAKFTTDGAFPSVLPPGAGDTTSTLSITGASNTGGNIDFTTGDPVSYISSRSTAANGSGGAIKLIAFAGTGGPGPAGANGKINIGTSVYSGGSGTGKNGDVLMIAGSTATGASILVGDALVTSNGATGGGGSIQLRAATPVITGGGACNPCVEVKNGAIISGQFDVGAIQANGTVGASSQLNITGPTAASGTIVIDNISQLRLFAPGSAVNITAGGDITTGYIRTYGGGGFSFAGLGFNGLDGGDVSITSNFGSITVNGDINTSGGGGGGALIGVGTPGNGGNAGNISLNANSLVTVNGPVLAAGGGGGTRLAAPFYAGGGSLGNGGLGTFNGGGLNAATFGDGGGTSSANVPNHVGLPGDAQAGKAGNVTIVAPDGISVTSTAGATYGITGNAAFSRFNTTSVYGHNVSFGALQPVTVNGEVVLQGTQTGTQSDFDTVFSVNAPSATVGAISYVGANRINIPGDRSLTINVANNLQAGAVGVKPNNVFGQAINIFANSNAGSFNIGDVTTTGGGRVFIGADKGTITAGNIVTAACGNCYGVNGGGVGLRAGSISTGHIFTYGGGGRKAEKGGDGGDVVLLSTNGGISVGSFGINTSGGGGGGRDTSIGPPFPLPKPGGDAGDVVIASAGNITLNGPVIALGGGSGDFDSGGASFGNGGLGVPNGGGLNNPGSTIGTGGLAASNVGRARSGKAGDILIGGGGLTFNRTLGTAYGIMGNAISSPFSSTVLAGHNITLAANGPLVIPGDITVQGRPDVDPTAVEYAVMLALIIVVCITAVATLGPNGTGSFTPAVPTGTLNENTVSNLLFSATGPVSVGNINFIGGSTNRNDLVLSANAPGFTFGNVAVMTPYAQSLGSLHLNVGNTGSITTGNITTMGTGGIVSVTSNDGNIATGNVTAHGGGIVLNTLALNKTVTAGNLDTSGNNSFVNYGGFLYLNAHGGITTGEISTYGNTSNGQASRGGTGGQIYITSSGGAITINGAVNSSGGGGGGTFDALGGDAGPIVITAKDALLIKGPVLSAGGGRGWNGLGGGNGGGSLGIGGGLNGGGLNRSLFGVGGQTPGINRGTDAGGSDGGSSGAEQVLSGSSVTITKNVGQYYGIQSNANISPYANFFQYSGFIRPNTPNVVAPTQPPKIPAPPPIPAPAVQLVQTITNSTILATDTLNRHMDFPEEIKNVKKKKQASIGSISSNVNGSDSFRELRLVVHEDVNGNVSAEIDDATADDAEDVFRPVAHAEGATIGAPAVTPWSNNNKGLYVAGGSELSSSADSIHLKKGEILTDGKSSLTIHTEFGSVKVRSGSIVLINADDGHLRILDVTDDNHGDVTFHAGARSVKLHPGAELCINSNGEAVARAKVFGDGLARRRVENYKGQGSLVMITSDCSLMDALSNHSLLKQFSQADNSGKNIADKVLKTAAALMSVTGRRGAYSQQQP